MRRCGHVFRQNDDANWESSKPNIHNFGNFNISWISSNLNCSSEIVADCGIAIGLPGIVIWHKILYKLAAWMAVSTQSPAIVNARTRISRDAQFVMAGIPIAKKIHLDTHILAICKWYLAVRYKRWHMHVRLRRVRRARCASSVMMTDRA